MIVLDKIVFNKLSVQDQLEYINNQLINGKSLKNISNDLKISKTTIRDRLKKIGYVFNGEQRQYIKYNCIPKEIEYGDNINILHKDKEYNNKEVVKNKYKENINILNKKDNKNKLIDILKKYDNLIEMMEWYNNKKNIVESVELNIDSEKLLGEVKTTTVRLYSYVWKDFREFMDQYQEFKNMDMINMALVEFMEKYKK